jgi:vacuolar-type H+-ATPase subunit H
MASAKEEANALKESAKKSLKEASKEARESASGVFGKIKAVFA